MEAVHKNYAEMISGDAASVRRQLSKFEIESQASPSDSPDDQDFTEARRMELELMTSFSDAKQIETSLQLAEQVLDLDPNSAIARYVLALQVASQGDTAAFSTTVGELLTAFPKADWIRVGALRVIFLHRKYKLARPILGTQSLSLIGFLYSYGYLLARFGWLILLALVGAKFFLGNVIYTSLWVLLMVLNTIPSFMTFLNKERGLYSIYISALVFIGLIAIILPPI